MVKGGLKETMKVRLFIYYNYKYTHKAGALRSLQSALYNRKNGGSVVTLLEINQKKHEPSHFWLKER